jgi:hypothetical protein
MDRRSAAWSSSPLMFFSEKGVAVGVACCIIVWLCYSSARIAVWISVPWSPAGVDHGVTVRLTSLQEKIMVNSVVCPLGSHSHHLASTILSILDSAFLIEEF